MNDHFVFQLPIQLRGAKTVAKFEKLPRDQRLCENNKWDNIKLLIVDEISMVSNIMLAQISSRLGDMKAANYKPFGNARILVLGDLFQVYTGWLVG